MGSFLWIAGLGLALLVYGGLSVGAVVYVLKGHHLKLSGWAMLFGNGYVAWLTFWYLRQKIEERRTRK